ncbi:MAG: hypothetical protein QOH55_1808 [Microbacteriaceae bacterium]|nr:hypothetical protein [Microbacteriaceae bacterium]
MAKRKRLSADLPVAWLTDPVIRGLGPVAWTLHTFAIIWSLAHETDGVLTSGTITLVRPPKTSAAAITKATAELVKSGLWKERDGGFIIANWADMQTTHEQFETTRARWRNSKRGNQNPTDAGDDADPADSQADTDPFQGEFHGGTPEELSYPLREGKERNGKERNGTEAHDSGDGEYDDAFASDPGLAFEADEWERQEDGSMLNLRNGEVRRYG